jgi:hypothetical protein
MWTAREGAIAIFASMTNCALYPFPLVKPAVVERSLVKIRAISDPSIPHLPPCRAGNPLIITVIIIRLLFDFAHQSMRRRSALAVGGHARPSPLRVRLFYTNSVALTLRLETHASEITT